jgi:ParB family chromosome partitioning protein
LGALISTGETDDKGVCELKINQIEPNTGQPRKLFDEEKLKTLAESIKQHGVVQPIIVRKEEGDVYRIVAGERRWRAARIAGLNTIPAVVKDISDRERMEIALIENLQREDLNPVEEAEAFDKLMKEYSLTQEQISEIIGKSRPAIANSLRLLGLSKKIKEYIVEEKLTSGHARALIPIEDEKLQISAAEEVIRRSLNVRDTEKLVKMYLDRKEKKPKKVSDEHYLEIEEKLKNIFGTKVKLLPNNKKGKIMIEYYSSEELERIIEMVDSIPLN